LEVDITAAGGAAKLGEAMRHLEYAASTLPTDAAKSPRLVAGRLKKCWAWPPGSRLMWGINRYERSINACALRTG